MRTIETTQSSFLLRYGAALIVFTELLMICTIMVLYGINGAMIPTFIMLFIAPLLGGVIKGKIVKKNKKVLFKENFNKYFIIANIIIYILVYLFNFRFNIVLAIIYGVGALIGFFSAKKSIKKLKINIEPETDNYKVFSEGEKIAVKQFKLEKFNGENIRKFLTMNGLTDDNYLLAQFIPTAGDYILYGIFSFSKYIQYIIHFNDEKLYFFELSKVTNKSIENGFVIKIEDIKITKLRKGIIAYTIKLEFKDGSKVKIQIPKNVLKMYSQKQYAEKLYNKLKEKKSMK